MPSAARLFEDGQGRFKVHPGILPLKREEEFDFKNITSFDAGLLFPRGLVEGDPVLERNRSNLEGVFQDYPGVADILIGAVRWVPANSTRPVKISQKAAPGVHEYTVVVWTPKGAVEAEGNSRPKVIVDP